MTESAYQGAADAVTAAFSYRIPGGIMEQVSGQQRATARARSSARATIRTAALTAAARIEHINELCHRMTLADTREVRMQLCAELKRAIGEMLARKVPSSSSTRDPFLAEIDAIRAACSAMNIYDVIRLREQAQAIAAEPRRTAGFEE